MKRMMLAGTLVLAVGGAAAEPTPRLSAPASLAANGADPTIAFDARTGARFAAWTRPGGSSREVVVVRSRDGGQGFDDPVIVGAGDAGVVASAVSPAQVAVGPAGEVYVLYERREPKPDFEGGRGILRLARSIDGGRSFAAPVDVVSDGIETGAGMAGLAIAQDGAVIVAWLDDRAAFERARLPADQRPKDVSWIDSDNPKVEVRLSRSTDGGKTFPPSVLIATGASERSRVSLTFAPDGTLFGAWRAKLNQFKGSYDSVRDVVVSSSNDNGMSWSAPVKVHDDRFKAGSCPAIAHGIGVDSKGRLHVAWYTGTSVRPGVYYAVSADRGKTFSEPATLLADAWVPYADVKLAVDAGDGVWIAFEDRRDDRAEQVVLSRIDPNGKPARLASWPGRAPDLAAGAGAAALVWTGDKGGIENVQAESK